jgi:outer membrane receptor protein involved in Fe transport
MIGPGRLSLTAEQNYSASYTNDYQGVPATATAPQQLVLYRTPGYATTNFNGSYSWGDWTVSGFVRNAFNRQYIASVLAFDAVSYPQELPGEPRTYGLSLKYKF